MSFTNYAEEAILNAIGNAGSFSIATPYVKLHIGDPGEDGTANAAAEATRKLASFAAAVTPGGTMTTDAALNWTAVAADEVVTHVSVWDASTGGNCVITGALVAPKTLEDGDNLTIAAGDLDLTVS
jgi:hypothetical protein